MPHLPGHIQRLQALVIHFTYAMSYVILHMSTIMTCVELHLLCEEQQYCLCVRFMTPINR